MQIANVAFRHRYSIGTLGFIRSTNPEIISLTPLDTDVPPLSLCLIFHSRSRERVRPFSFASSITRPSSPSSWATDRGINRAQMKLGGREVNSRTASILLETSASLVFACYTLLPPPFSWLDKLGNETIRSCLFPREGILSNSLEFISFESTIRVYSRILEECIFFRRVSSIIYRWVEPREKFVPREVDEAFFVLFRSCFK